MCGYQRRQNNNDRLTGNLLKEHLKQPGGVICQLTVHPSVPAANHSDNEDAWLCGDQLVKNGHQRSQTERLHLYLTRQEAVCAI